MFSGKLQKYRGLFIAVTSLVVFFLVYLFVGQALQRQALTSISYSNAIKGITEKLDATKPGDSTSSLSSSINVLRDGGTIDGEKFTLQRPFLAVISKKPRPQWLVSIQSLSKKHKNA